MLRSPIISAKNDDGGPQTGQDVRAAVTSFTHTKVAAGARHNYIGP